MNPEKRKYAMKQTGANRTVVVLLMVTAVMLVMFGNAYPIESGTLQNYKQGEELPPIQLPTVNDNTMTSFVPGNGKPALIMFFSVRPEFRKKRSLALLSAISEIADNYMARIAVVGIFSDDKGLETVIEYMEKSSIRIKVLHDEDKAIHDKYGVFMMPIVILADKEGKLREVIPYTYNIRDIVEGNVKYLLGIWNKKQLAESLKPRKTVVKSKQEKEYIRRINYGRLMQSKKMYGSAIREFSTAVRLMPNKIEGHIGLGFALLKSKKYDRAEASFRKALMINPDSDDAIAGLGLTYYGRGETELALKELEKAFISEKPMLDVIVTLAEIYEQKGMNDKANRLNKLAVSILMKMYEQRWK
jgi:tetratricopeptide (TPR) repeat protein